MDSLSQFRLDGQVAVVTGGGGVLGSAIARGFAGAGAKVAIADYSMEHAGAAASGIVEAGGTAKPYAMDVHDLSTIQACAEAIASDFGDVDILLNAVGGNRPGATTGPDQSFFDLPLDAINEVVRLNFFGGVVAPSQVIGRTMAGRGGSIINISSMAAIRPLTRVMGYAASKAAVDNFTKWLAVHVAQEFSPKLRVNAIAPGFFLTEQNRYLLTDKETGELTARGRTIIDHTPMGRFGDADDLVGVALWLASDASKFTTGIVVPVDGGFSAFSGV